ncbi:hypothetical protein [Curtobacterium ammoniigenes]|uniref:hypothetical protein n=1 Tax=Curtobacterium ammoniigenes TaxID=395387 RepID=UPI00082C4FA0|nr:hypothetical protein [Curtobacterium ammoniigenes]
MSSDAQPPLTRRQLRERERASGGHPGTPDELLAAPPSPAADEPSDFGLPRRRPGSHAAAVAPRDVAPPAQSGSAPLAPPNPDVTSPESPARPAVSPSDALPASATEIVPGTGMTRRELRALRQAQEQSMQPVPLRAPQSSEDDRTVADVLGSVAALDDTQPGRLSFAGAAQAQRASGEAAGPQRASAAAPDVPITPELLEAIVPLDEEPAPDSGAIHQAVAADSAPEAVETLEQAAAEAEEPRRHRSTWAPPAGDEVSSGVDAGDAADASADEGLASDSPVVSDSPGPSVEPVVNRDLGGFTGAPAAGGAPRVGLATEPNAGTRAHAEQAFSDPAPSRPATARPTPSRPATGSSFGVRSGHWSLQSEQGDAEIHDTDTGVRRVAEMQTSALILPNTPLSDVTGALNATGEVIITGSIDLPKSLSSTGSHRPIDGAEVDRLLEQQDEIPTPDASPVRASRAVSSHTSTRAVVLAAAKPKESRGPIILAVSAATAAVAAVAAIVVAGFALHFF